MNPLIIHQDPLPYAGNLQHRSIDSIDLAVIHCTELPDLATARKFGEKIHYPESGTGNSGHYYVERSGGIQQWVPLDRVAHHVRNFNERSIGIELDNLGRYPDWLDSRRQTMTDHYPSAQITALAGLLEHLADSAPGLKWIAGHESLDVSRVAATDNPEMLVYRKRDPGPLFPWVDLLSRAHLKRLEPETP